MIGRVPTETTHVCSISGNYTPVACCQLPVARFLWCTCCCPPPPRSCLALLSAAKEVSRCEMRQGGQGGGAHAVCRRVHVDVAVWRMPCRLHIRQSGVCLAASLLDDACLARLLESLVQAARQWWRQDCWVSRLGLLPYALPSLDTQLTQNVKRRASDKYMMVTCIMAT